MTNSSLKIGIDGRELLPNVTVGFGRFLANFLNSNAVQNAPHHFVIYGKEDTQFPESTNFTSKRLKSAGIPTLWWDQITLARNLKKDNADLLFTPYDKAPIKSPCPVVMTVHDLLYQYFSHLSGLKKTLFNTLYKIQRGLITRRATHVLTVSEHSKQDIVRFYNISPDKISVCYNTVAENFTAPLSPNIVENTLKKYGIQTPYIFNLTNFKPHKNPKGMLEGFAHLKTHTDTSINLVMAGAYNEFTDAIHTLVKTLGISDSVIFVDRPSDTELHALYTAACIFAYPSLYEGFGIPPLEAMACNTPIVVSNTTSLPEVVGDAGFLVAPTNPTELSHALNRLLTEPDTYKQNQKAGLERSQLFTIESFAQQIMHILENVGHNG